MPSASAASVPGRILSIRRTGEPSWSGSGRCNDRRSVFACLEDEGPQVRVRRQRVRSQRRIRSERPTPPYRRRCSRRPSSAHSGGARRRANRPVGLDAPSVWKNRRSIDSPCRYPIVPAYEYGRTDWRRACGSLREVGRSRQSFVPADCFELTPLWSDSAERHRQPIVMVRAVEVADDRAQKPCVTG